jgi:hypothetical protein
LCEGDEDAQFNGACDWIDAGGGKEEKPRDSAADREGPGDQMPDVRA